MRVARVNNINETINELKKYGIWICGTDMSAKMDVFEQDYNMPLAIVIGSEGSGMGKRTTDNCDFLVKIPMNGQINSLNASVSAGIIMYEVVRNRKLLQK